VSILDLIDSAIADATSDDAVRYNAPEPETPTIAISIVDGTILYHHWDGDTTGWTCTGFFVTIPRKLRSRKAARLRRMHTAHPARWRRP
jgi:hypothetical protein